MYADVTEIHRRCACWRCIFSSSCFFVAAVCCRAAVRSSACVPAWTPLRRTHCVFPFLLLSRCAAFFRFITAVPHTFAYIAPDFLVGPSACVLFLSLRYHQLFPSYLSKRIEDLADGRYTHKFLLLHVDLEVPDAALAQVTLLAFHHCFSLLLGTCLQECAGVLQLLKAYEKKPADTLLAKLDAKHCNRVLGTQVLKNRKYLGSLGVGADNLCTQANLQSCGKTKLDVLSTSCLDSAQTPRTQDM
uniref:DNA repair protein rad10 subfamily protein n=1 Tax=Toxoplasma gondii COUG TaxID=1074873 RepID=A0A2G8YB38_TOXGO|nr:DNA repair protein rad10 subfamily protein [Toxoplasma gondii COUG]